MRCRWSPNNATVVDIQEMGNIPLRMEKNVYLRDVATIRDDTDITYGYALVNGKKSVYLPIIKKDTASTLTVVADIHKSMQPFRDAVPKDVTVDFEFDESPTVVAAIKSVATEGLIGAALTGLDDPPLPPRLAERDRCRFQHPARPSGSLFGLWLTGNTINIMSLGGLALAIGILVDEATVAVENVHVADAAHREHCLGSASWQPDHGRAAAAGLALHPLGVHPGVHHGRPAPVAVHAFDAGGRLCHDLVVPALEHASCRSCACASSNTVGAS